MREIDRLLQQARPGLVKVAPIVFWVSLGYGITNLVIGAGLAALQPTVGFVIVGGLLTLKVWAAIFAMTGVGLLYSLYKNDWKLLKSFMITGLVIKLMWLIALVIRIADGGTILLAALWVFFAYIQVVTVIFMPVVNEGKNGRA